jgi:hypothetical protein
MSVIISNIVTITVVIPPIIAIITSPIADTRELIAPPIAETTEPISFFVEGLRSLN